jgi:hypothetical protein
MMKLIHLTRPRFTWCCRTTSRSLVSSFWSRPWRSSDSKESQRFETGPFRQRPDPVAEGMRILPEDARPLPSGQASLAGSPCFQGIARRLQRFSLTRSIQAVSGYHTVQLKATGF